MKIVLLLKKDTTWKNQKGVEGLECRNNWEWTVCPLVIIWGYDNLYVYVMWEW